MRHYRTQTDQNREAFVFIGMFSILLATTAFLLYLGVR
jgi:hypothetical protein